MNVTIEQRLERIERMLARNFSEVMSLKDVAQMLGKSESRIRHLVSERRIPFYRNDRGQVSFRRSEVEEWQLGRRVETRYEIESNAVTYTTLNPLKK